MINNLSFLEKSLFFANVSATAYKKPEEAREIYSAMGFKCEYFDHDGSQAYLLQNEKEIVVAFRRNRTW